MEPMDEVSLERAAMDGDSGSLVAWNGSNNRQVAGLMTDQLVGNAKYIFYIRADYIKSAFYSAGRSFDHYWGTASSSYWPSTSQYDFPC
jgi:hypothetical protein